MTAREQWTGPLGISVAAIFVTAIVVIWQMPGLLQAAVTPAAPEKDVVVEGINEAVAQFQENHRTFQLRFLGRYLFYPPRAPAAPSPAIVRAERTELPLAPTVKQKPKEYAGPLIPVYPWGKMVVFNNKAGSGKEYLAIGDEREGVKLVSIDAPHSAVLRWEDQEWQWNFFQSWKNSDTLISEMREKAGHSKPLRIDGVEINAKSTDKPAEEVTRPTAVQSGDVPAPPDAASPNSSPGNLSARETARSIAR